MAISWYPGHMNKARKELIQLFKITDAVIEVLDARTPLASSNPLLATLTEQLPVIKILNKTDLADPATTIDWLAYFNSLPDTHCLLNGRDKPLATGTVLEMASHVVQRKPSRRKAKQLAIIGIPNVGKSSLLNQLSDRKIAKTGNEPAVTKAQQRVKLDEECFLIDTPGMMWPKLEDQSAAYRLACTGTIRNTAVESADIAWFAAEMFLEHFRFSLESRYAIPASITEAEQLLQFIAENRGTLGRGGHPDWNKTSEVLLNDYRSGKLGILSLEKPPASLEKPPA